MSADTRYSQASPWKGPVNTWDPVHMDRHLVEGAPDPARYPVHARGTWRRALLYMSQGYRPAREDVEDLGTWSRLTGVERKAALAEYDTILRDGVAAAAAEVLAAGEVLGTTNLAARVAAADYPGLPGRHRLVDYLRAVPPVDLVSPSSQGGIRAGSACLYRAYLPKAGGKPGHFFATSRAALKKFWKQRQTRLIENAPGARQGHADTEAERMTG